LADTIFTKGASSPDVELVWQSPEPVEGGVLASDLAFVKGKWLNLDHWRYWLGTKRPRDDRSIMAPEALIKVRNAFLGPDNQIVTESGTAIESRYFGSGRFTRPIKPEEVVAEYRGLHGSAMLNARNYGHWLLQRLPRFVTLHEQAPGVPILNSVWGDQGLLARLGIDESEIRRFPTKERGEFVFVDELLVPTHLSRPGLKRAQDKHRMDRMVRSYTEGIVDDPALPELLYVARRPDDKRSGAANKDELQEYLEGLGFVTWYPIDDPIERQIQHFRAARVVVSEIGSQALTSMFAGADTTVIILTPEKSKGWGTQRQFQPQWRQWQRVVCEARGQHYAQIIAASDTAYRAFELDMDTVRTALDTYPLRTW
jgi:hypothetical protein